MIADAVGDNVGDVAGMGADLYESYVGSIVAPVAYAALVFVGTDFIAEAIIFPLAVAAVGMFSAIIGSFFVRVTGDKLSAALLRGNNVAAVLTTLGTLGLTFVIFDEESGVENPLGVFLAVVVGLLIGVIVGKISEIFTSDNYKTVKEIRPSIRDWSCNCDPGRHCRRHALRCLLHGCCCRWDRRGVLGG